MEGAGSQAAADLAAAGHQLFQAIFRHNVNDPLAREIQNWLHGLRDRNEIASLDMLGDVPGRIPWNVVYEQEPAEQSLRSGDPSALRPFWGFRYALAAGKRVNPLRVASVLEAPSIVLVADTDLIDALPAAQKNLLSDWAAGRELPLVSSARALRDQLRDQAPDILYLFARVEQGSIILGGESITLGQIRDFLAGAKEGNPDPVVFLQACGTAANYEAWECFVAGAVNTLSGVITSEVPASPALANTLGVEALTRFLASRGLGEVLREVRAGQDLAALAYSAFCPAHVKVAGEGNADPNILGPEPLPLPDYPYFPLVAFESEDRGLFTGREDDTVRCASLLDEAATHGLVLHGAGGVGKSSFLRAGLVPHLETEAVGYLALRDRTPDEQVHEEGEYPVVALRPGNDLLGQLADALCVFCAQPFVYTTPAGNHVHVDLPSVLRAAVEGVPAGAFTAASPLTEDGTAVSAVPLKTPDQSPTATTAVDLWRALDDDPGLLARICDELTRRLPSELVVVVDEAEDWVLQTEKAAVRRRQRALQALGAVLRSPARCKIILSMRTEYCGRLMDHVPPAERWRSYFLDEFGTEQMLRAMLWPTAAEPVPYGSEVPRQKYHFTFEQDLPAQIVSDVNKAARVGRRGPLPLLQIICAELYDRMKRRKDEVITKADRKDQGSVDDAAARYVNKKMKSLPITPADRIGLETVMDRLYRRHTDGTITRDLVPIREVARSWKSATPLETVVDAAAQEGLVDANEMLVEGRPELLLSLPQESLAQTALQWDDERKRRAYGRTRIGDTLWIMIPMLFLAAAITWTVTRNMVSVPAAKIGDLEEVLASGQKLDTSTPYLKISSTELDELLRRKQAAESQSFRMRWPMYLGEVVRAEQAWNNDNVLVARQTLLTQQPLNQPDLRDFEWFYLWNKIQGKGPESAGHKGLITSVAISPDGTIGASAAKDGTVKLWNLVKVEENATLQAHTGPVLAVAFSLDGKTVASAGADKIIRIWDAAAGKDRPTIVTNAQKTLTGHTGEVRALAFGQQGLVSAGADSQVIAWDLATGKPAHVFKEHTGPVQALALSSDGKTIASAGSDARILIHDGTKTLQTIKTPASVSALAFAPDGKTLASGGTEKQETLERGMIRFWDPATGKEGGTPLQHASEVFSLAYVPTTKLLASAGKDNLVRLWDPAAAVQVHAYRGHIGWVAALGICGTKPPTLLSGSHDGTLKIWSCAQIPDPELGQVPLGREGTRKLWSSLPPDIISAHEGAAEAVAFAFDDKVIISGGRDGTVKFWDPTTGKRLAKLDGLGRVTSLALNTKDKGSAVKLAAGTWSDKNEGEVRLWELTWDVKDGLKSKELPALKGHTNGVTCVEFSPDGQTLASGSADRTAILWEVSSGKQKSVLKGHEGEVRCLAFASEGGILMTGGGEGKVRQWSIADGKEVRPPLDAHAGGVNAVRFFLSAIGFVTAGDDRSTKFWIWAPDKQARAIHQHRSNTQPATALTLSANRRFIASSSLDQTVKLYDSQVEGSDGLLFFGQERFTFTGLNTAVRAVAVSGNSLILAGAGEDGTIRLWRAAASGGARPES
jgi:WD40 repeat protein